MGDNTPQSPAVEQPVADPSQVAPAGTPTGIGEDPSGSSDTEQEAFVLDAFAQDLFGSDEEPLGISQGQVAPTDEGPAATPVAPSPTGAVGSPGQAEPAAPPPVQQTPEVPGQQAQQPQPSSQAQQAPVPPTPQAPVEPQAQAPAVPQVPPEGMFQHLEQEVAKNREVFEKALQEQVYKLSDKEQDELRDNVEVAVPKLMARMHVNVVQNMLATIAQQLPQVVGGLVQARTRSAERENSFYQRWPQLDRAKHGDTVKQLARSFMHANPTADFDTAVRMVGAQALVALNLPVGTPNAPAQPAVAQQQVMTPGPVVRQVSPAYVPGGVQVAAPPVAPNGGLPTNPFEAMDQFLVQDEQGAFDR